jgi:hypothetical protein
MAVIISSILAKVGPEITLPIAKFSLSIEAVEVLWG